MSKPEGIEAQLDRINDNIGIGCVIVAIAILLAGGAIGNGIAAGLCFVLAVLLFLFLAKSESEGKKKSVESKDPIRYRHYEGGICELVCEAATERDHTAMVIYRAEDGSIRCSPKDLFFERIEVDGRPVQRYVEISERD